MVPVSRCSPRLASSSADDGAGDPHLVRAAAAGAGVVDRGRQVDVDEEQLLGELGAPGPAARRPAATTIESPSKTSSSWPPTMFTYATVGARLGRPAGHQRQPDVVLVQLVRRAVDVHHQADPGPRGHRERAARLPDVLADGQRDVDAADPDHLQRVARHEVAVLVEDAVVGQVVLEVRGHHPAAVQDRQRVARAAPGCGVGADPGRAVGVEVADDAPRCRRGRPRPGRPRACPAPPWTRPRTTPGRRGPRPGSRSASSPGTRPGGRRDSAALRVQPRTRATLPARSPTVGSTWARAMRSVGTSSLSPPPRARRCRDRCDVGCLPPPSRSAQCRLRIVAPTNRASATVSVATWAGS